MSVRRCRRAGQGTEAPIGIRLVLSRSPPQPSTTCSRPSIRQLPQRAQDRFDGVRLVGVVDDREVRLAHVHTLQAARHARDGGDAVGGGLRVDPGDGEGDDRGEGVRHVEGPASGDWR